MPKAAQWQPDPLDFYEPGNYPQQAQRLYRTLPGNKRLVRYPTFCHHCHEVIPAGETTNAVAVVGATHYRHPPRIHEHCRPSFILAANRTIAARYGLILNVCISCQKYMGCVDGEGTHGLSGTYCDPCQKKWTNELADRKCQLCKDDEVTTAGLCAGCNQDEMCEGVS